MIICGNAGVAVNSDALEYVTVEVSKYYHVVAYLKDGKKFTLSNYADKDSAIKEVKRISEEINKLLT